MIKCSACNEVKPDEAFYRGGKRCKACRLAYQREWNALNLTPERLKEYQDRFRQSHPGYATLKKREWVERNPERAREHSRKKYERWKAKQPPKPPRGPKLTDWERKQRHFANHPVKAECRKIYKYALRSGSLVKGPCEVCGAVEVDGHHTDYTRPLDVVWLCKEHHRQAHREMRQKDC